jgi:long-chain acyl-CoA synthetase
MPHDVIGLLLEATKKHPERTAITQGGVSYTYAQLGEGIVNIASSLQQRGVKQGDRFLFSVRPNPDGILLALGIVASGGVVVFADPGTAPELFDSRIKMTAPRYAAAESLLYMASLPMLSPLMRKRGLSMPNYRSLPVGHYYSGHRLPGTPLGATSVKKLLRATKQEMLATDPSGEAIIAFTSGTTAHPRAVVHSRASLGSGMHAFIELTGIDKDSSVYTDHFMFGVTAMICGGQWEIPNYPPAKDAGRWLDALLERKVTHTFLVPADTTLMLDEIERRGGLPEGANPLPVLAMGAAPVLPPLIRRVEKVMPQTKVLAVYGMTEILPVAVVDGAEKVEFVGGDLAGRVIPGVTARIEDMDDIGTGELILSGDGLMLGYLGEERKSEHRTGDIATLTADGRLVLLGRKKDMLIRSNKNIYPGLYEPGIMRLDGISSCVIVGVPDMHGEDIVVLLVVPEKGQDERKLRSRLESHLPDVVDLDALPDVVIMQDEIPLSGRSSKPNRIQLRKDAAVHPEVEKLLNEHARV